MENSARMARTVLVAFLLIGAARAQAAAVTEHSGMCDASAAVSVGSDMFVVANDEDNILRVYKQGEPQPRQEFDLNAFLKSDPKDEVDIEGATRVANDVVYWISSHGANKKGKPRPTRRRLFAMDIKGDGGVVTFKVLHRPYTELVADLANEARLQKYNLDHAAKVAPEAKNGLNIEGLASTADGRLLIGFRNPIPGDKALIVPLNNPENVVKGAEKPKFGDPIELDLGGAGVRSLEFIEGRKAFLIVAGPPGDNGSFKLFQWSGPGSTQVEEITEVKFDNLNPEAFVVFPGSKELFLISDDGGRQLEGQDCKDLGATKRRFRTKSVPLP